MTASWPNGYGTTQKPMARCRVQGRRPTEIRHMVDEDSASSRDRGNPGYMNARIVKGLAFVVITLCLVISAVACILAIWQFASTDVLWRTVATCWVVAAGAAIFAVVNRVLGR
jgi:hypothetical protein